MAGQDAILTRFSVAGQPNSIHFLAGQGRVRPKRPSWPFYPLLSKLYFTIHRQTISIMKKTFMSMKQN